MVLWSVGGWALKAAVKSSRARQPLGLIFAENQNDADSLGHLICALWTGAPSLQYRRKPLVLIKGRAKAEARKNADQIAQIVKAQNVLSDVKFVVAHQDCDSLEPHDLVAKQIHDEIVAAGVENVVAVAPAWELEAWWFLWPEAVASVNSKWRKISRKGNHGMISNAKEVLTRDLRSQGALDYRESDSVKIAKAVRDKNIINKRTGVAPSFESFESRIKDFSGRK